MEPSFIALPRLSSYLPSFAAADSNRDVGSRKQRDSTACTCNAVSSTKRTVHHLQNEQLEKRQGPFNDTIDSTLSDNRASLAPLNSVHLTHKQAASCSTSVVWDLLSPKPFVQSLDVDTLRSCKSKQTTSRKRASRYLSDRDRREIITRIIHGEKQVTLAREFGVSRAAICNLYKNRWTVLSRVRRSIEPQINLSSPLSILRHAGAVIVVPNVSTISICTESSENVIDGTSIGSCAPHQPGHDSGKAQQCQGDEWCASRLEDSNSSVAVYDRVEHLDVRGVRAGQDRLEAYHITHEQQSPVYQGIRSPASSSRFFVHEASVHSQPCRNLLTALRDVNTSTQVFRQRVTRLVRLLLEEALSCLPQRPVDMKENLFGDVCHGPKALDEDDICGVSMEDKGMALLRAFATISPASSTGVIFAAAGSTKDSYNGNVWPSITHARLPVIRARQVVLLLDVQCVTGTEACAVLHHLVHERQIPAHRVYFVTIMSSFEGLYKVAWHFSDVKLISAHVSKRLDGNPYYQPGVGDFMQRYWDVLADCSPV